MGRVPEPGEPLWSEQDRTVAMAWFTYQERLCGQCGVPRDEGWDRDADGAWVGEVLHCHVCAAMDRARDQHLAQESSGVTVDKAGLKLVAHRRSTDG